MGKVGYMLFPSLATHRDRLVSEREAAIKLAQMLYEEIDQINKRYDLCADQLTAKTLECASLQARLTALQPAPLEPKIIKASTAADVRRLVEQENLREQALQEQETANGIR